MHAILFQMAFLPLTMARLSIAAASKTSLNTYFPFNKSQRIHIHLGYVFGSIAVIATIFFFAFFGLLCSDGEQAFCDKFTSEIMITGYITVAFVLIILSTSFFRDYMPYEVFYGIHHLVFAMYLVVLLHTIDINVRKDGQNRSQTFKWFSATLLYYVSDRLAMRLNHRYKTRVLQAKIVKNTKSSMILLQLRRPSLFQYEPGQYAHLRFPDIDSYWHPFSIGSSPDSNVLEFYIEVYDDKSWTGKLCQLLGNDVSHENVRVQVTGPYGTRLGDTHRYSHAMAIGSGSGVVPILGLYKKHICQLLRLDPQTYFEEQAQMHSQLKRMERAREQTRGSWLNYFLRCSPQPTRHEMGVISGIFDSSDAETKDLREAAKRASLPIYGVNILMQLVVLGVIMLGLTLSWNTMPFELYDGMREVLIVGSIVFQGAFAVVSIGYWDRGSLLAYVDVLIVIAGAVANWYWFEYDKWANFEAAEHVYYILLFGYMTARLWHSAVKPRYCSLRSSLERQHTSSALDKLHFVWITRSSTNVLKIAPTIMQEWNALVAAWGLENAVKVCQVSIYVTDKDKAAVGYLKQELSKTPLYKQGAFHYERPDISKLLEEHAMERIYDESRPTSSTLLCFCGSPKLSSVISKAKTIVDISTMITGNKYHQMDFVSESYSAYTKRPSSSNNSNAVVVAASAKTPQYSVFMDSPSFMEKQHSGDELDTTDTFEDNEDHLISI